MNAARVPRSPRPSLPVLPANVVELRPGIRLPEQAPETPEIDGKSSLRNDLLTTATQERRLLTTATKQKGKKRTPASDLLTATGRTQVRETVLVSQFGESPIPDASDPTFRAMVGRLPAAKLREMFPHEATTHRNMLGRERTGRYRVADAWRASFRTFLLDMGPAPHPTFTLDRKNPLDPLYGAGTARWAGKRDQAQNRANTVMLTAMGQTRSAADWGRLTGQDPRTITKRYRERGWTQEEAVRGWREGGRSGADRLAPLAVPEPEPAPADTGLNGWPAGVDHMLWETAWTGFLEQFGGRPVPGLSKPVFLAWLMNNQLSVLHRSLRKKYPAAYDPEALPNDPEPPGMHEDPDTLNVVRREPLLRAAMQLIGEDRDALEALRGLRAQWPNLIDPRTVPRLARYEVDDD